MSIKSILTHVIAGSDGAGSLRTACDLAVLMKAHLVGVGGEASRAGGPRPAAGEPLGTTAEGRTAQAAASFAAAAAGLEAGSTWLQVHEAPLQALTRHAGLADVVVAYRPGEVDDPRRAAPLDGVLTELGGPVLVSAVSQGPLALERIMVAWDNSRECRRAISDAMPLLIRAGTVALVAVGLRTEDAGALTDAQTRLRRHGVTPTQTILERDWRAADVAEQLNAAADDLDADVIVLGAYGRSHLREWAFGGVTQAMLGTAERALFFSR